MAPISSAGNYAIPTSQPSRNPVQAEKVTEKAADDRSRKISEQIETKTVVAKNENQAPPPVTQIESEKSAEEQQKIEAAQQEAQRAEFDQQAGNVRETEPNAVRPPSTSFDENSVSSNSDSINPDSINSVSISPVSIEPLRAENPAIDIFVQLQNIDNPPRQGQEVNRFA